MQSAKESRVSRQHDASFWKHSWDAITLRRIQVTRDILKAR